MMKSESGFSLSLEGIDFSTGNVVENIKDSTKSNAFDEVETNPFRYENE